MKPKIRLCDNPLLDEDNGKDHIHVTKIHRGAIHGIWNSINTKTMTAFVPVLFHILVIMTVIPSSKP